MQTRLFVSRPARRTVAAILLGSALAAGGAWHVGALQTSGPPGAATAALPSLAGTIERVTPAVVNIRVERSVRAEMPAGPQEFMRRFFGDRAPWPEKWRDWQPVTGVGSGFVISADGHIVTNHHVVAGAREIAVTFHDKRKLAARLVGADPKTDLALLKVEAEEPLAHAAFGDSGAVRVGDWVVAVGNPFGLGHSATAGIVSARGRQIGAGPYDDFLQISAPINRGNSGGPTFNLKGEVIGVNTAIFSPNGGNVGIGFAVPAALANDIVAELKTSGAVERGRLGVRIQHMGDDLAESLGLEKAQGALVASVDPSGPAAAAGLKAGDVILEVDGERVVEMRRLPRMIAERDPGRTVKLKLWRDGAEANVEAVLAAMPAGNEAAKAVRPKAALRGSISARRTAGSWSPMSRPAARQPARAYRRATCSFPWTAAPSGRPARWKGSSPSSGRPAARPCSCSSGGKTGTGSWHCRWIRPDPSPPDARRFLLPPAGVRPVPGPGHARMPRHAQDSHR